MVTPDTTAIIIPARLESKRFPNKLLAKFNGKSILQNVIDYTKQFKFPNSKIILATEDQKLIDIGTENGLDIFKTTARCGTEKAYQYYLQFSEYDQYITIPSDEPYINPKEVNKAYDSLDYKYETEITTFYTKFYKSSDFFSSLSCKVVANQRGYALYFSRAWIPSKKDYSTHFGDYKKHVGIFIFYNLFFRSNFGPSLWSEKISKLEEVEGLEQNRFLDFGISVRLLEIFHKGFGIDLPSQIPLLEERFLK